MNVLPIIADSAWRIIDKSKKPKIISKHVTNFVSAKGSIPSGFWRGHGMC
jgi:hypothetical protein